MMPTGLSGVVASFQLLIRCLTLLAEKTDARGNRSWGALIYSCSKLFQSLISRITPCLTAIMSPPAASPTTTRRGPPQRETNQAGGPHIAILAQLFHTLLAALEPIQQPSPSPVRAPLAQLLEAVTYLVLASVGDALYVLHTGHGRPATIREEIALDALVRRGGARARIDEAELQELWRAVKAVLAVTRGFQAAREGGAHAGRRGDGMLALDLQKRLERTLVTCIWSNDPGDEMEDVLRRPVFKGRMPNLPKGYVMQDSQDWFFGEMFSLIGWGMLMRRDE
jgi:hypothetical protein